MASSFDFDRPLLLDGGTGRELLKRRVPILTYLWASTALFLAPDIVRDVHFDFIKSGADVITTNTYGLARDNLAKEGIEDRYREMNLTAARLADEARDKAGRNVAIAGSLPPLARSYRPDLVGDFDRILELYREQAEILAPRVDLFICETMSTGKEALAAATAATETDKPVWVSWTLSDDNSGRLRSGETISEAARLLENLKIHGFLCNCCSPESISAAVPELASIGRGKWGGYANTFAPIDATKPRYGDQKLDPSDWERYQAAALPFRDDLPPDVFATYAEDLCRQGAQIVGGCCGAGPAHIARLRSVIDGATPNVVRS